MRAKKLNVVIVAGLLCTRESNVKIDQQNAILLLVIFCVNLN